MINLEKRLFTISVIGCRSLVDVVRANKTKTRTTRSDLQFYLRIKKARVLLDHLGIEKKYV